MLGWSCVPLQLVLFSDTKVGRTTWLLTPVEAGCCDGLTNFSSVRRRLRADREARTLLGGGDPAAYEPTSASAGLDHYPLGAVAPIHRSSGVLASLLPLLAAFSRTAS